MASRREKSDRRLTGRSVRASLMKIYVHTVFLTLKSVVLLSVTSFDPKEIICPFVQLSIVMIDR